MCVLRVRRVRALIAFPCCGRLCTCSWLAGWRAHQVCKEAEIAEIVRDRDEAPPPVYHSSTPKSFQVHIQQQGPPSFLPPAPSYSRPAAPVLAPDPAPTPFADASRTWVWRQRPFRAAS